MNTVNACFTVCCLSCLLFSCANNTFTQQGQLTTERICYDNKCYTTIKWEDGSFSSVEDAFLPSQETVYRHCYVEKEQKILCSREVYEQPILIFDRNFEDIERAQE
jgi:hypothetical protein